MASPQTFEAGATRRTAESWSRAFSSDHSTTDEPMITGRFRRRPLPTVPSPWLSHQLAPPTSAIGFPPLNPSPDHPTSDDQRFSYSSSVDFHPSSVSSQNALQLQPPPLDTSFTYPPSLPSVGAGRAPSYIPPRPSPLQHSPSRSQSQPPDVQELSGKGQPATHPTAGRTPTGVNTPPPIEGGPSDANADAPATVSPADAVISADS